MLQSTNDLKYLLGKFLKHVGTKKYQSKKDFKNTDTQNLLRFTQ